MPRLKKKSFREIRVYDYIPWERRRIKETIMNELAWEKPAGHVSTWRSDCLLVPLVTFAHMKSYGCTKACFGYCNMINNGQMERREALEQEEEMLRIDDKKLRVLLQNTIGLSKEATDKILNFQSLNQVSHIM
jgi:hypothetical protein